MLVQGLSDVCVGHLELPKSAPLGPERRHTLHLQVQGAQRTSPRVSNTFADLVDFAVFSSSVHRKKVRFVQREVLFCRQNGREHLPKFDRLETAKLLQPQAWGMLQERLSMRCGSRATA
jgi:hypothetical protein